MDPESSGVFRLALDTGATRTLLNPSLLVALGYDLAKAPERVEMTTGSGVEFVSMLDVERITALGVVRDTFPVLAHTLPPSASIDGLLGVDFFADRTLTIRFVEGELELE